MSFQTAVLVLLVLILLAVSRCVSLLTGIARSVEDVEERLREHAPTGEEIEAELDGEASN